MIKGWQYSLKCTKCRSNIAGTLSRPILNITEFGSCNQPRIIALHLIHSFYRCWWRFSPFLIGDRSRRFCFTNLYKNDFLETTPISFSSMPLPLPIHKSLDYLRLTNKYRLIVKGAGVMQRWRRLFRCRRKRYVTRSNFLWFRSERIDCISIFSVDCSGNYCWLVKKEFLKVFNCSTNDKFKLNKYIGILSQINGNN